MKVLIVGAGKVGKYLVGTLAKNHEVILVDKLRDAIDAYVNEPSITTHVGDACDPNVLEVCGASSADAIVAATGDDEDNLVIAQLAKLEFKVQRVLARVNNPKNQWLFSRKWGVDIPISAPHIILQLIEEELSLGDIVTLMKLKEGKISLIETTVGAGSLADGKTIEALELPQNSVIAAILTDGQVSIPYGGTSLQSGNNLLIVTDPKNEELLNNMFLAKEI